ncbi:Methyltransferase [Bacillus cereus]|nr:Methyltransferase [Bacillus cereus]
MCSVNKNDYFYENYRIADFYDDQYGMVKHDIPFWLNITKDYQDILEIACGTGRITIPLLESGKNVYAVDYSEEMLNILDEKIKSEYSEFEGNIVIENQDMRYLELNKKFDMIIITSNSLNHIETNDDLQKTFEAIKKHLNDDGLLVFDILNPKFQFLLREPEGVYAEEILKHESSGKFFKTWENNIYSAAEQINYVTYYYQFCDKIGTSLSENITKMKLKVRLYFPQEIDYIIQMSSLKIHSKFDWYDQRVWEGRTGEQILVLKK